MYIKKISSTNCQLIPQLLMNHINHSQQEKKVYLPVSTKFMWLQKYAQSHEPTIEVREQFDEFAIPSSETEKYAIKRDFSKKLKPYKAVSKENCSKSKLIDIDMNQLNFVSYNNDNKRTIIKEKQNLQNENQYKSTMGAQNSLNLPKKLHCKSTDIYSKKYQTSVSQISARKKAKATNLISVGGNQKQLINRLQFKRFYNSGTKEQIRLPTSKTTRKADPSKNHQTVNIKNILSDRNNIQRKYSASQKQYRKKKSIIIKNKENKENEILSIQLSRTSQQQLNQNKFTKFQSTNLSNIKNHTTNYNSNTKKYKNSKKKQSKIEAKGQNDTSIDLNPWNHHQSSMSFSEINLAAL